MKYWGIFLLAAIIVLFAVLSFTPSKKLKCVDDMCMILEKTFWNPKSRIKQYFFKSDIKDVRVKSSDSGADYLVITTKSDEVIELKFIHSKQDNFIKHFDLTNEMNRVIMNIFYDKRDYESEWQKDVGSFQIYVYGKPLFQ